MITNLGNYIWEKREKNGYSLSMLSKITGYSTMYLCDIENHGRFPVDSPVLKEIAKALHIDYAYLNKVAKVSRIRHMCKKYNLNIEEL